MLCGLVERNGEYGKVIRLSDEIIADVDNERKQGGGMWNDDSWYTINGQKLIAKPSQPGLYIHNNKKVIIK